YSSKLAPQYVQRPPFPQSCSMRLKRILPCGSSHSSQLEYLPFAFLEQYTLRRESKAVIFVIGNANNCFLKISFIRFCLSGISLSKPIISRLAISRRKIPVLQAGSRKVMFLSRHISSGNKSSIWLAMLGGVNTSSLLRLARQLNTSGL